MQARILAAIGSVMAMLLATWLTTVFYASIVESRVRFNAADPDIWWLIGIPLAVSTGIATLIQTRHLGSLSDLRFPRPSLAFVLRGLAGTVLLSFALLMAGSLALVFTSPVMMMHGTQPRVPVDIGSMSLLVLAIAFVVMQFGVLLMARQVARAIEREERVILQAVKEREVGRSDDPA